MSSNEDHAEQTSGMGNEKRTPLSDGHQTEVEDSDDAEGAVNASRQSVPASRQNSFSETQDVLIRHHSKTGGLKTPAPSVLSRHRARLEMKGRSAAHNDEISVSTSLTKHLGFMLLSHRFLRMVPLMKSM